MSGDWKVGDLAVCVDDGVVVCPDGVMNFGKGCKKGRIYRVVAVTANFGLTLLHLDPFTYEQGSFAVRFRKIKPDALDACEEEFRILLKLSKKRVKA